MYIKVLSQLKPNRYAAFPYLTYIVIDYIIYPIGIFASNISYFLEICIDYIYLI